METFSDRSEEEMEPISNCVKSKMKNSLGFTADLREQIKEFPDVIVLIENLQRQIEKEKKKIRKLKRSLKRKKNICTVGTQTETALKEPISITEEITMAAEEALQKSGFVYEETSGLYYDYSSGYYYNAEYGLYYDGNTGTYLKYDNDTKEYKFHSQVDVPPSKRNTLKNIASTEMLLGKHEDHKHKSFGKRKKKLRKETSASEEKDSVGTELEEGECSNSSSYTNSITTEDELSNDMDYAKNYPPCMRIIVEESDILKPGSLYVVTYEGGSVGREGSQHAITIADINISKHHFDITYDQQTAQYLIKDVGSQNGTYLNGKRLSESKEPSGPLEVVHSSRIQIGGTTLLCHIHSGSQTCGHCEPGLLILPEENPENTINVSNDKKSDHRKQLKKLRKKFGLERDDPGKNNPGSGYVDRAQKRRDKVGSQNPYEKTQMASLNESIPCSNKGFKLLAKLGWKEGDALGKQGDGNAEPIPLVSNEGFFGLGHGIHTKFTSNTETNNEL